MKLFLLRIFAIFTIAGYVLSALGIAYVIHSGDMVTGGIMTVIGAVIVLAALFPLFKAYP